ncbi:MAG TPA: tetraacyldisaccharide 4'-kinase [Clostridia bacterium]|nr:tetraacyldisaccharide 4'-kinase [Clostridia bacterium]
MNPISALFGLGVASRNALYDRELIGRQRLKAPVVSIGNISVGGTGKTPFAIALGQLLLERSVRLDVLSRGYRRRSEGVQIAGSDADPDVVGDEPALIASRLGVPVIVAARRAEGGRAAEEKFGSQLHLLDDGFQHRQLARQFDIVLLSPSDMEDRLLPFGRLREPVASLRRADAVVVDESFTPRLPDFAGKLWRTRRKLVIGSAPKRPVVFCGIAKPQQFFQMVSHAGVAPATTVTFRDHHRYTENDLQELRRKATQTGADGFLTTEKDAVKLRRLPALAGLSVVRLEVELLEAAPAVEHLMATLGQRCPGWFRG